jgi:RNA polymerase sigma-70 factor, ECF subfamily
VDRVAREEPVSVPASALDDLDDRALVERAVAGDREAFGVVVLRHQRAVYRLCYRFVGNHDDAADLAQDVFLRAYRALKGFKGASSLATWLYRIGVNVCLNRVTARALPTEPLESMSRPPACGPDPSAELMRAEVALRVRSAIARLPKKQRATVILRVYHDLSHAEVASVLGTSVGAVKANLFHALASLKRMLSR